jgi:hypothetical protein
MKYVLLLCSIITFNAGARTTANFIQAINQDVQREIKKDDEKFKKEALRKPASVESGHQPVIQETPKLDKNIRQIGGPDKW